MGDFLRLQNRFDNATERLLGRFAEYLIYRENSIAIPDARSGTVSPGPSGLSMSVKTCSVGELTGAMWPNEEGLAEEAVFPDGSKAGIYAPANGWFMWATGNVEAPDWANASHMPYKPGIPWETCMCRTCHFQLDKPLPFPVAIQWLSYPWEKAKERYVVNLMELSAGCVKVVNDPEAVSPHSFCPPIVQRRTVPLDMYNEQVDQRLADQSRLSDFGPPHHVTHSRELRTAQLRAAVPFLRD